MTPLLADDRYLTTYRIGDWTFREHRRPSEGLGTVYFIQAVGTQCVKIGWTQGPVDARRGALQIGCPYPLRIILTLPGVNMSMERTAHVAFEPQRIRESGEWFYLRGELKRLIQDARASRRRKR